MAPRRRSSRGGPRIRSSPSEEDFIRDEVDDSTDCGDDETEFEHRIILRPTNASHRSQFRRHERAVKDIEQDRRAYKRERRRGVS